MPFAFKSAGLATVKQTQKILDRVLRLTELAGFVAVGLMVAQITADVISEYVFRFPLPATVTSVSNYYMLVVAFLPLALAERRDQHISVEVLFDHFPAKLQSFLTGASYVFSALVFGGLAWQTWIDAMKKANIGSFMMEQGVKVPIWPAHFMLPIGAGLLTVVLILKFILHVQGKSFEEEADV